MKRGPSNTTSNDLKSERIQLKSERIQQRLEEVSGWKLAREGRELFRNYEVSSPKAASALAQFIAQVAEDLVVEPSIRIVGKRVEVQTKTSEVGELSDSDFDFAAMLEGSSERD